MTHPSVYARTQPDKIAYQMAGSGKAITYRELDELSNQGAHLFRSLGLKAGDHVAFLIENRLAFMEICWAAQRSGLYYTAISRYLTKDEIAYIVEGLRRPRHYHLTQMRRPDQGTGLRRGRCAAILHDRRTAARLPLLGRRTGEAADDADSGRSRRLRHAVFVRYHRAAQRHQACSPRTIRSICPIRS